MRRSLTQDINLVILSGLVVTHVKLRKHKRLTAFTRLRIRSNGQLAYVDIVGFEKIANQMNLLCQIGDVVYVEGFIHCKVYENKKGEKKCKLYFVVTYIDRLIVSTNNAEEELEDGMKIITDIDPTNYLDS